MPTYTAGGTAPLAWGTQPGMSQTYTAMKPRQTNGSAQEWQEIKDKITAYVETQPGMTICDVKKISPEYRSIIEELDRSGEKEEYICYPTQEAWMRRADVRARIVQALTNVRILQPVAEAPVAQATPEAISVTPEPVTMGSPLQTTVSSGAASSHADVLQKVMSYLKSSGTEICDLRKAIPAYGKNYRSARPNEKFKPGIGDPAICYPSPEVWEADTKGVKTDIMAVLTEQGIL